MGNYRLVDRKSVPDSSGFYTDYSWYVDREGNHVFILGDSDLYDPDYGCFDWECDSWRDATEWYEDYDGAYDDQYYDSLDWYDDISAYGWYQQDIIDSYRSQR